MVIRSFATTELRHPYNKAGDGPEGPEIRVTTDKLRDRLLGYTIVEYSAIPDLKGNCSIANFLPLLIQNIDCHGKKIIFFLTDRLGRNFALVVAFMMTGRFSFSQQVTSITRAALGLQKPDSQFLLLYEDSRKFGVFDFIEASQLNLCFFLFC